MSIFSADHENAASGWLYQDLLTNSITDDGRKLSIDLVQVSKNTAAGWRSAADGRADADHRFYEVTISTNANLDTALKNLQYFFIRADREMERRKTSGQTGPRLGLLVHLPKKPKSRLYKLQTFLSMLSYLRNQYDFLYSDNDPDGAEKVCKPLAPSDQTKSIQLGNMMPLLRVVADRSRRLSGDILLSDLLDVSAQDKLPDDDITACFGKNGQLPQNWWKSLQSCCHVMLIRTFRSLTKAKYTAAAKQLPAHLCRMRAKMPLLAELIWFFQLQALAKNNELTDEAGTLKEETLDNLRRDAIVCAEALTQILENSCQHARQKSAYLCLRLHRTSLDGAASLVEQSVKNRSWIITRYANMWSSGRVPGDGLTWKHDDVLLRDAKHYFEISVTDDAAPETPDGSACGILDHYLSHTADSAEDQDRLPTRLQDLFEDSSFINRDHMVLHYGLQALRQHILVNRGSFLVTSPRRSGGTEMVLSQSDGTLSQRVIPEDLNTTEYHILLPLGMPPQDLRDSVASAPATSIENILDPSCLKDPSHTAIRIHRHRIAPIPDMDGFPSQSGKDRGVDEYTAVLRGLTINAPSPDHTIFLLDIRDLDHIQTELFSKALFRTILENPDRRLLFALFFSDTMQQQITIRMCAVFYRRCRKLLRQNAGCTPYTPSQVALCSRSPLGYPEVNMTLNFRNWDAMTETMIRYAYNNLTASHDLYAQIKYFLYAPDRELSEKAPVTEVFPFDLYLHDPMDGSAGNGLCWFLQNVHGTLTRDIQKNEHGGIKVNNIHVHLPTNVHLESFYAADLLFRNVAYVCRFAYLLALRLKQEPGFHSDRSTLVVCYEAYSGLLMQYLEYYLNQITPADPQSEWDHVRAAIVYREKKHSAQLYLPSDLEDQLARDPNFFTGWNFVVLSPIATTLSTIHMLHELIGRKCGPVPQDRIRDYTIILVGQLPDGDDNTPIQDQYWTPDDRSPGLGTVRLHDRRDDGTWPVGYVVRADVPWHDPAHCAPKQDRALVHADTTATELKLLFPMKLTEEEAKLLSTPSPRWDDPVQWKLLHRHDVCSLICPAGLPPQEHRDRIAENNRRLELLRGCIYYSHIVKSSNHYAYYLEFSQCYEHICSRENRDDWQNWLKSLRKSPRRDVLTILVAPLRLGISPLLKALIDHVFTESIHVLQLDLQNSRRLDILTKYAYVAQTCRDALKADPSLEIHFHYIDDSIVTADTLRRGQRLVDTLLRSHISPDVMDTRVKLFSDVYVMLNRSSRDTAKSLVADPDRNFHAYMHLAVPHFNTHNDHCPSCAQVEKFQHLKKCSSTNRFAGEFQRLAAKHLKRSPEEYLSWQEQQLMTSRSAFLRLRQWVFNRHGLAPTGLEAEYELVLAHLEKIRTHAYQEILGRYRAMVLRENREVRWEEQQEGRPEGSIPRQPNFADITDLLKALRSPDVYREAYREQNSKATIASIDADLKSRHPYIRQEFLKELAELKLCDYLPRTECTDRERTLNAYRQIWFRGVLSDQAYRRMITVHDAFSSLVLEKETETPDQMYKMILNFLQNRRILGNAPVTDDNSPQALIDKWEWLHSGLKVLSRNDLVHYHMVRASMFQILRDLARTMLSRRKETGLPSAAKLLRLRPKGPCITLAGPQDEAIDPLLRYQLFSGIMRRLADMQSVYPIETLGNDDVPNALLSLTESFFRGLPQEALGRRWFYCTIPSYDRMMTDYEKYIKLSTMAEDDETKSSRIQDSFLRKDTNTGGNAP